MLGGFLLAVCLLCPFARCHRFNECPPAEDIEPCTCDPRSVFRSIKCRNLTDSDTLYDVLDKSGQYPFVALEILSSTLTYLPAAVVKQKQVRHLTIEGCVMTSLFESRPDHADSLEDLLIQRTRFLRGIDWNLFSGFRNLERFFTIKVEIKKLGKLFKDNVNRAIEFITVVNGKTAVLEDDVFSTMTKLRGIEISNALVKTLKRSMFSKDSVLRSFNFRGNLIKSLPEDIFSDMPDLRLVYLENNRLTTLPETIYANVYKHPICILMFDNNPLNCDCSVSWIYFKELKRFLSGTCAAPPSKKGKSLDSLSRRDFPQCRQS